MFFIEVNETFEHIIIIPLKSPTIPPATHTNCYILGSDIFIVIDPATDNETDRIMLSERIQKKIDTGSKPLGVILSHHHIDHIGAAEYLRETFGFQIFAHSQTIQLLQKQMRIDEEIITLKPIDDSPEKKHIQHLQHPILEQLLSDWQLFLTPGHAPGHICFFHKEHGYLIVGDMVASVGTILIEPQDGNMRQYIESLHFLKSLQSRYAFPAHGNPIDNPSNYFEFYIQHRLFREQKVLNSLSHDTPKNLDELVKQAYNDVSSRIYGIAKLSLESHLIKLIEEKRVLCKAQKYFLV